MNDMVQKRLIALTDLYNKVNKGKTVNVNELRIKHKISPGFFAAAREMGVYKNQGSASHPKYVWGKRKPSVALVNKIIYSERKNIVNLLLAKYPKPTFFERVFGKLF